MGRRGRKPKYLTLGETADPNYRPTPANWRLRVRREVLNHYGAKCVCCGEQEHQFLAIDHKFGGGLRHRKEIGKRSGDSFYAWIIKNDFPEEFQILCHNCNLAKGFYGVCPHEKAKEFTLMEKQNG